MIPTKPKHKAVQRFLNQGVFSKISNFGELEKRISALSSKKEKGDAFEVFAEAYFSTQLLHQVQEIWPEKELPQSLRDKLGIPYDAGVDGVFKTHYELYNAYQVKFRTNRRALTWDGDGLGKFFGQTDLVNQRVLFTNSIDLSEITSTRSDFYSIKGNDLDRLEQSDFQAIENWLKSGSVSREKKSPFPHQSEAINDILQELNVNDQTTAIMACATGKTLVALWVAEKKDAQTILVLLPSLALVRQTLHDWARENSWDKFNYLCVCSDATVIKSKDENDETILHQHDLDFSVTTQKEVVEKFLRNQNFTQKIIFSTYQSCQIVAQAMPQNFSFDLAIFDEAHKTASRQGAKYSFALQDENLAIKKRLFLTATPRHYNVNKKDKDGNQRIVFSMDDQKTYGRIAHQLSFRAAVEKGVICDYKIIISQVTSEMVNRELIKRGEVVVDGDIIKAQRIANILAIQNAVDKYGMKRIFSFHNSVKSAKSFTSNSNEGVGAYLKDFTTLHVNGEMSTSRREKLLEEFKESNKAIVSNARCLTEGVNVPAVDMVVFVSPKKSKGDIVQVAGRAMRKSEGKSFGYILIPLFVQIVEDESTEEAVKKTQFDTIWDVLQAMKEQDESLAEIINQMMEDRGRTLGYNDNRLREKIEILGPEISINELRKSITTMIIDNLGSIWDERFGELCKFKDVNGHCNVPKNYVERPSLGIWVDGQRCRYKDRILSLDKIKKLEDIGFDWDPTNTMWEKMFSKMCEFKKAHNHCDVPSTYNDKTLAAWVTRQRTLYKKQQLIKKRMNLLVDIGFVFKPDEAAWDEQFSNLCQFKKTHNHCNVPQKYPADSKLGLWVTTQRAKFRKKALSKECIEKLNSLGFDWMPGNIRKEKNLSWKEQFFKLCQFKTIHNHCNVPIKYAADNSLGKWVRKQRAKFKEKTLLKEQVNKLKEVGFVFEVIDTAWNKKFNELNKFKQLNGHVNIPCDSKLNKWTTKQRAKYKNGKLSSSRINKLKEIGFNFESIDKKWDDQWEDKFKELCEFKALKNHCNVPKNNPTNPSLGTWVDKQRANYKTKSLSQDKTKKLESIEFDWDPIKSYWEKQFSELQKFKNKFGNCDVARGFSDNISLANWVNRQRAEFVKGKLPPELVRRLKDIGFIFAPDKIAWEKMFSELCKFKEATGNCLVPQKYPQNLELGRWVSRQRSDYKKGNLSQDRIDRLNKLGFVWKIKDSVKTRPWNEWFSDLCKFKDMNGNFSIPSNTKLSRWAIKQRLKCKNKQMSSDRMKKLNSIGFI